MNCLKLIPIFIGSFISVANASDVSPSRSSLSYASFEDVSFVSYSRLWRPSALKACAPAIWPFELEAVAASEQYRIDQAYLRRLRRAESSTAATLEMLAQEGYLDPDLRDRMDAIYREMREVYNYELVPVEGFRSPERQAQLLATGSGITSVGAMHSCHQYGLALDSALMRDGKPQWDMSDPWTRRGYFLFGELATRDGLEWGGHWTTPKDFAHVELKSECIAAKRSMGTYFVALVQRLGRRQLQ